VFVLMDEYLEKELQTLTSRFRLTAGGVASNIHFIPENSVTVLAIWRLLSSPLNLQKKPMMSERNTVEYNTWTHLAWS
jgi:hypothetical protein